MLAEDMLVRLHGKNMCHTACLDRNAIQCLLLSALQGPGDVTLIDTAFVSIASCAMFVSHVCNPAALLATTAWPCITAEEQGNMLWICNVFLKDV